MSEVYSFNELLMISEHRKINVMDYRNNHAGYKDEVKNDRTTFFSFMSRIGLENLIKDYIDEKGDCLDISFKSFIDYIFDISTTGRAKTYQENNTSIAMLLYEADSRKEYGSFPLGDIAKDKVRQKIRKGIDISNFSDKDIIKAYTEICLILKVIFSHETKELEEKYNQRLRETDIILFHEYSCIMGKVDEINDLPRSLLENKNINREQKSNFITQLEDDFQTLLNKWDEILFECEPQQIRDEVIGFIDPKTGSFILNKEINKN